MLLELSSAANVRLYVARFYKKISVFFFQLSDRGLTSLDIFDIPFLSFVLLASSWKSLSSAFAQPLPEVHMYQLAQVRRDLLSFAFSILSTLFFFFFNFSSFLKPYLKSLTISSYETFSSDVILYSQNRDILILRDKKSAQILQNASIVNLGKRLQFTHRRSNYKTLSIVHFCQFYCTLLSFFFKIFFKYASSSPRYFFLKKNKHRLSH